MSPNSSDPRSAPSAEPLFSPLIETAIELAAEWHDGTYRKSRWRDPAFETPEEVLRIPVMAHLTAVAMLVQRAGWDETTVAAAFLHDLLEDENRHGRHFRESTLREIVGDDVVDRVLDVTEAKYDDGGQFRPWRARKQDYIDHLHTAPAASLAISLADKLHNLWSINQSLETGVDVFTSENGRRGLSAGPEAQLWFHSAVLYAAAERDDPRLEPLRARLADEVGRFERLAEAPLSRRRRQE